MPGLPCIREVSCVLCLMWSYRAMIPMFQPFCCVGLWYIRGIQEMRSLCDKGQSTGVPREDIFLEGDFVQLR